MAEYLNNLMAKDLTYPMSILQGTRCHIYIYPMANTTPAAKIGAAQKAVDGHMSHMIAWTLENIQTPTYNPTLANIQQQA